MFTTLEKNHVRALISSPGWNVLEQLAQELYNKIASEPKSKETQWLTARQVVFDEGQQAGIKRFLQEIMSTQL